MLTLSKLMRLVPFLLMIVVNITYADTNLVKNSKQHGAGVSLNLPKNLRLDTPLMNAMLSNSTPFNNELFILDAKNTLNPATLYVGGYGQGGANFVNANQPTSFYSNNLSYKSRNYLSLDRASLALIGSVNSWVSVYFEAGATDIGQSYASPLRLNQSYLLLGNGLFPLYGFAGYKNIDFGNFSTVNIFAQPVTRWDYAGTALTMGAGYRYNGFNLTLSAVPGGTEGVEDYYGAGLWRVYNYPNDYTTGSRATNFAVNTSYSAQLANVDWTVGAGYMRGLWLGSPITASI